ncbi:MAG: hypothetical protein PHQ40_12835 [Anaerolineaceae bacterium]|nr:hypothetical protein [Anaerolineaceae bacterium]
MAYSGDVIFTFLTKERPGGIVTGWNRPSGNFSQGREEIPFAWQISEAQAWVIEYGTVKAGPFAVTSATVFGVVRRGGAVFYLLDGALAYASGQTLTDTLAIADSSLYAGDDAIINAAVAAYTGSAIPSASSVVASTAPTVGIVGTYPDRITGASAPTFGVLVEGVATMASQITGSTKPTVGIVGTYPDRIAGETAPTSLSASSVPTYTPGFTAVFGASPPTYGFVMAAAGRVSTIAGSSAPTTGRAGLFSSVRGDTAPSYGLMMANLSIAAFDAPMPTVIAGDATAVIQITAPSVAYTIVGSDSPLGKIEINYPAPVVAISTGGSATLRMPAVSASIEGASPWGFIGSAALRMPAPIVSANGLTGSIGGITAQAPRITYRIDGAGEARVSAPSVHTITASGTSGSVGSITLRMPRVLVSAQGESQGYGRIEAVAPAARMLYGIATIKAPKEYVTARQSITAFNTIYSTNLKLGETTQFTNYPFKWIVRFNGEYLAMTSTKQYTLGSNSDNGTQIQASAVLHPIDFDTQQRKRIPFVYVGSTVGHPNLSITVDGYDHGSVQTHSSTPGARRVKLPRGAAGRYWTFGLSNHRGEELKVDGMDFYVDILTRKV